MKKILDLTGGRVNADDWMKVLCKHSVNIFELIDTVQIQVMILAERCGIEATPIAAVWTLQVKKSHVAL